MKHLICGFLLMTLVLGQTKVGTAAASFLGIGVGPRATGMGGAFTAVAEDASIIYWNPGGISRLEKSEALFSKADWLVNTNLQLMAAVLKLNPDYSLGVYFTNLNYGETEITDLEHQHGTGQYWSASDIAFGVSLARNLTDRFSFGFTGKYISQHIYNSSATSFGVDLGLLYRTLTDRVKIGMSISNFGADMTIDGKDLYRKIDLDPEAQGHNEAIVAKLKTDNWPLPLFFRVGTAITVKQTPYGTLLASVEAFIPSDDTEMLNLGLETNFKDRFYLQTGYKGLGNPSGEEGITFGAGTQFYAGGFDIQIQYAVQNFGTFGFIPHLGLVIQF